MTKQPTNPPVNNISNNIFSFIGNLSIPNKLIALSLGLTIPFLLSTGSVISEEIGHLQLARESAKIAKLFPPAVELQKTLRTIRSLEPSKITAEEIDKLKQSTKEMSDILTQLNYPEKSKEIKDFINQVDTITNDIVNKNITKQGIFDRTTVLLVKSGNIFQTINDISNTTDINIPHIAEPTNLTVKVLPKTLPELGRPFGAIENIASQAISNSNGVLTPEQRAVVATELNIARITLDALNANVEVALKDKEFDSFAGTNLRNMISATAEAFDYIEKNVLKPGRITVTVSEIDSNFPKYITAQYTAFTDTTNFIAKISEEHTKEIQARLVASILLILFISTLVIFLTRFIIISIVRPLDQLTSASKELGTGNLGIRVNKVYDDELGTLSETFNISAAKLEENAIKAEMERLEQQQLQNNIGKFLDIAMDIAEGDLTKRGTVTEDTLGNVVDSINLMTENLGYVIGDVRLASESVNNGSEAMLRTTSQIEKSANVTSLEAQKVTEQTEQLIASIRKMAEQAKQSEEAASQALNASREGQEAVVGTLNGMENIRREVQNVAKRIKGLGDRSLEIQEIVDTISAIARQTNLLALNATIEAAGAGEAGGRFSIVAEEVRKLADNSAAATGRIAKLIQNIQNEIQDVVINVEESTSQVEQGYRIAGTAGEKLRQISTLTQQSAMLVENISESTLEQVNDIEKMGEAVRGITEITKLSEQSIAEGRSAAEELRLLAEELNKSLEQFKLPR